MRSSLPNAEPAREAKTRVLRQIYTSDVDTLLEEVVRHNNAGAGDLVGLCLPEVCSLQDSSTVLGQCLVQPWYAHFMSYSCTTSLRARRRNESRSPMP